MHFSSRMSIVASVVISCVFLLTPYAQGFPSHCMRPRSRRAMSIAAVNQNLSDQTNVRLERKGFGHTVLNFALKSPFWSKIMVPAARRKIIDTAEANGIPWKAHIQFLQSQAKGPWNQAEPIGLKNIPAWYSEASYHGYDTGHLSWLAAMEMEVAAASIGARNLPKAGRDGEAVWRGLFSEALRVGGAISCEEGAVIVDVGCGTGASTRLLAQGHPKAQSIIGIDLSPYFVATANYLLTLCPDKKSWVTEIEPDSRIRFLQQDGRNTCLNDNSVDVVSLQFVTHETPAMVTLDLMRETLRVLKPGGQLWYCEMDFESPHFANQRNNPLLFSLLRATEPFLDEYAEAQPVLWEFLRENFGRVTIVPATGRHFACVCTKVGSGDSSFDDQRFNEEGRYRVEDTHLQIWEVSRI